MQLLTSVLVALSLQAAIVPRYLDLGNGTVVDTDAQLVWAGTSSGAISHEAADRYLNALQTGGYSDWRLPSAEELRALFDPQQCRPLTPQAGASMVCLPPAIDLLGPAVWTIDRDGSPAMLDFGTGELRHVEDGSTGIVLPVRKSQDE